MIMLECPSSYPVDIHYMFVSWNSAGKEKENVPKFKVFLGQFYIFPALPSDNVRFFVGKAFKIWP